MNGILLGFAFLIALEIFRFYQAKRDDKETDEQYERLRKRNLKEFLESREVRKNLKTFDEEKFWKIIEDTSNRCKGSYKNQLGLIKDLLRKMSPEDLIELDNLLKKLTNKFINYDLAAASYLILKTAELKGIILLMNILMTKGQVTFKNASLNPNLIIGMDLNDIVDLTIQDLIAEMYSVKTNKPIPVFEEIYIVEIKGNPWTENEIPTRYSELWNAFA